ncbi:MAG: sulfatase [Planctomycetota bacterium]|nr:sulfatase [Planctomycetota bacterium]
MVRSLLLLLLPLLACHSQPLGAGDEASDAPGAPAVSPKRPNILFVYSDDHATNALGTYGSTAAVTPRLDRLASEGLRFDRAFCTNGICAPARAVVLTGQHSHINGVTDNSPSSVFDPESQTFPKLLGAAGYQTAMIGKWHLKSEPTGFDHWEVLPGQGRYYSPQFKRPGADGATETVVYPGYVTEVTTELALDWLNDERDPDQPFLLMVQHKAPHRSWMPGPREVDLYVGEDLPEPGTLFDDYATRASGAAAQEMSIANHMWMFYDLMVPPIEGELGFSDPTELDGPDRWASGWERHMSDAELATWNSVFEPANAAFRAARDAGELEGDALTRWKYQRYIKNYLRCINGVDKSMGQLLDWLDESGLAEDTIVVYSSDQGFYLGEHGWYDKRWMYEESLRLPLILRWPGVVEPGRTDTHLVQNLDFAPTFLEAAGVSIPADMQGMSMLPILRGDRAPEWRDSIYYEYFEVGAHNVPRHYGVRTDRHKLIYYYDTDEWELFDLVADPDELNNLAGRPRHAALRSQLEAELARLRAEYEA